jgi:hypothetical protein
MYQNAVFDARRGVRLWEEDGELVGFETVNRERLYGKKL